MITYGKREHRGGLQESLEAIDNANLNEAMEELEMLHDCSTAIQELPSSNWVQYAENEAELDLKLYFGYENIKQALLKSQELEKVLEIIKEKNVDIGLLKRSENWLDYYTRVKHKTGNNTEITEEEFNFIKEMLKND